MCSKGKSTKEWFVKTIESTIKPLLKEYWFESNDLANKAVEKLIEDL